MCGRYYVDDTTAREILRIVRRVSEKFNVEAGDIYPSGVAPVIGGHTNGNAESHPAISASVSSGPISAPAQAGATSVSAHTKESPAQAEPDPLLESYLTAQNMQWGFPGIRGKGVVFNARSETALDKRMFRDSILSRRCIVPATAFYEWDKNKDKITFQRPDAPVMFMAGFYKCFANADKNRMSDGSRFVLLTTGANDSVSPIHERMPILLDENELEAWIFDDNFVEFILHKRPGRLEWYKAEN